MLPKINGKSFLECTEEDLKTLIDNLDFRENEYIDYKLNFSFLEYPKGKDRNEKIAEFKSDVCSFANAEGGYLLFGISDIDGCASELVGIDIGDPDKFELDRRNNLIAIQPKIPYVKFHFVKLESGKYIVIIFVKHDGFSPYLHIEDEKNYKIYKRMGNGKRPPTYTELKNMFNQSLSLDKEIHNFRMDRINYYRSREDDKNRSYSQFLMLHFIPETFIDTNYNQNMAVLAKTQNMKFSDLFNPFYFGGWSAPCADGIRFKAVSLTGEKSEGHIFNNCVVECFFPLHYHIFDDPKKLSKGYFDWKHIFEKIKGMYESYADVFKNINENDRFFVCPSIIGCKDLATELSEFGLTHRGEIDRDLALCTPVVCESLVNEDNVEISIKKLYIEFLISIGVSHDEILNNLIKEVYDV